MVTASGSWSQKVKIAWGSCSGTGRQGEHSQESWAKGCQEAGELQRQGQTQVSWVQDSQSSKIQLCVK